MKTMRAFEALLATDQAVEGSQSKHDSSDGGSGVYIRKQIHHQGDQHDKTDQSDDAEARGLTGGLRSSLFGLALVGLQLHTNRILKGYLGHSPQRWQRLQEKKVHRANSVISSCILGKAIEQG